MSEDGFFCPLDDSTGLIAVIRHQAVLNCFVDASTRAVYHGCGIDEHGIGKCATTFQILLGQMADFQIILPPALEQMLVRLFH